MFDTHISYLDFFFLLIVSIFIYYSKKMTIKSELNPQNHDLDIDQITSFLKEYGGNHASHLIFLQDKEIFWTKEKRVLIVYKHIANKLFVLGDPIGEESYIQAAIKEFNEFSKIRGLKAIFYQISPKYMHLYHETGYRFLKMGEEGTVNLNNFTLAGKQGAKLRTRVNKFTRNAYTFRVVNPPYSEDLLSELQIISDSWLGKQHEKGFSVVSFSEEYVSRFPVALLSDAQGNTIAFATLATDYRKRISIDLMRKSSESPHGTMDVLFIHIFNWAKEKGYDICSLGIAPLSNVGNCQFAFSSEKLIRLAYLYGNSLYNFRGLKEFKDKFACAWEPKYLAYKSIFLPSTFIQLLLLINTRPNRKQRVVQKIKYLLRLAS